MTPSRASSTATLIRALGLSDATFLVIGCIVGVGIFRTASSIAGRLPSPMLILGLWMAGGLLSLCGALCYAELAAMFPNSGGDYVYIHQIYGRFWGFLFGWTKLFIERTGTIAILGFVFAEYCSRLVPIADVTVRLLAATAILLLTAINILGIRWGKYIQNLFTVLKILALVAITLVGGWAVASGHTVQPEWSLPPLRAELWQSAGVALVFVLWTFGGWTEAAYVAEEVRDPTRNVPRAIVGGLLLVTVLYVLVNWSYLLCLSVQTLPHTPLVASSVMQAALGTPGATFIAIMVACSAFGALNGYILTGARILYAIGKDHALLARLGVVHPTLHTPMRALWTNACIAVGLVFTKTLDQIMTYSTVVIAVFFTMAVLGVIIRRRTHPTQPRPYRAWGYPITPVVYAVVTVGFIADIWITQPQDALFGFGWLAAGVPLYWLSCAMANS